MKLKQHYIDALRAEPEWHDWQWQLRHSVRSISALQQFAELSSDELSELEEAGRRFRWSVTPYVLSLIADNDPDCPIRRQHLPSAFELAPDFGNLDPLEEKSNSPVPAVVHVYEDRVAFKVVNVCPTYCRYCFREYYVNGEGERSSKDILQEGLEYIAGQNGIRDVLLTGGDPLMLSDERLGAILDALSAIDHVEIVRIGSRVPCTLPQRITRKLVDMLRSHHPLWLNTHFNHPRELSVEARQALALLVDAGIPVGNQSVLLRGINDDAKTMKTLCERLLRERVRPYYVYQCQTLEGTSHFRVPIEEGIAMIDALRGHTTGFAIPTYVLDTPGGKVPLNSSGYVGRDGDYVIVKTPKRGEWRERNPAG